MRAEEPTKARGGSAPGDSPGGQEEATAGERRQARTDGGAAAGGLGIAAGLAGSLVLVAGLAASRFVLASRTYAPWVEVSLYLFVAAAAVATALIVRRPAISREQTSSGARAEDPDARPLEHFQVETVSGTRLLRAADIRWIEAAGNYARLHTAEGAFLYRLPLSRLEKRLARRFVRVHRSAIVNVEAVRSLDRLASGDADLHLHSGETVRLSRRYTRPFHQLTGRP